MSDPTDHPNEFLPFRQRIRAVVALILEGERGRASQEGVPATVFSEGTLNTFLDIVVGMACSITFHGEELDSAPARARVARIQRAVTQFLITAMAKETNSAGGLAASSNAYGFVPEGTPRGRNHPTDR